jgi:hypothetical protein
MPLTPDISCSILFILSILFFACFAALCETTPLPRLSACSAGILYLRRVPPGRAFICGSNTFPDET